MAIEYRWANGQYDRLRELASDLVKRQVAVIVASGGSVSALAAKKLTSTIPIAFSSGDDPVKIHRGISIDQPFYPFLQNQCPTAGPGGRYRYV